MASSMRVAVFLGMIAALISIVAATEPATLSIDLSHIPTNETQLLTENSGAASYDQAIASVLMLVALMASSMRVAVFLGMIAALISIVAATEPATLSIDLSHIPTNETQLLTENSGAASYDQAISYVLMLLALVFTYIFH
ncbi:hypothetical protein Ahy_A07g033990 isoform A [Arachis hypogaea]|uniref:Uncharacterized protein n=2 Tax=Arachis hypogaea TaxID=3818 RepID=A0A445CAP6_ARAHY|nr:hypothetical protein Ahy_A07g033990 isoform A [Arachis hypogaea]